MNHRSAGREKRIQGNPHQEGGGVRGTRLVSTSGKRQIMSELQKKWAKARLSNTMQAHAYAPSQAMGTTAMPIPATTLQPPVGLPDFNELDEEDEDQFGSLSSIPNHPQDDDSSSASSVSSTGTVIPSPGRALFARPQGYVHPNSPILISTSN